MGMESENKKVLRWRDWSPEDPQGKRKQEGEKEGLVNQLTSRGKPEAMGQI